MFLHLGEEKSILYKDIIGIFDYDLVKKSEVTKEFLDLAVYEQVVEEVSSEKEIKSFIVTKDKVFLSPISSLTLKNRILNFSGQKD